MRRNREPCMCGDPECPRCYPFLRSERDAGEIADERYERDRQEQIESDKESRDDQ